MGIQELDRVRQLHQLGSLKIVSILRVGVVMIMFAAMQAGDTPRWRQQAILVAVYAVAGVGAALVAFSANVRSVIAPRLQLVFAIVDVTVVYGYKLLSPPGAYVPLLVMLLLPIMVVLDVSWRRAATVLTISAAAFAVEVYDDRCWCPPSAGRVRR